jgi:Tol biopolymer transport system component
LIESPFVKAQARFSPDTRWIAYVSNESNGNQIVVQPFPDLAAGRWQVSTRGGQEPRWSPDGRELFYMDPDGVLMAVDVSTDGDALEPGLPRPLFRTGVTLPGPNDAPEWLYAVAPDGERFLINEPVTAASSVEADAAAAAATPMLNVIVNWTTTLGQR